MVQLSDSEVSEIQSRHSSSVSTVPRPLLNCLDHDQPEEREVLLDIVREVDSGPDLVRSLPSGERYW